MINIQEIYVELFDAGYIARLEPCGLIKKDADLDWDKNLHKNKKRLQIGTNKINNQ